MSVVCVDGVAPSTHRCSVVFIFKLLEGGGGRLKFSVVNPTDE